MFPLALLRGPDAANTSLKPGRPAKSLFSTISLLTMTGLSLPAASVAAVFVQPDDADGTVVIESENFTSKQPQKEHEWVFTSPDGASGSGALEALPNNNTGYNKNYIGNVPQVDYEVDFKDAGTYYVWVRGLGPTGRDDSIHVGLNNSVVETAESIDGFDPSFGWSNHTRAGSRALIEVATPGVHTINLWMREDGFVFDKLLLTGNASFTPTGTGPDQIPTQTDAGETDSIDDTGTSQQARPPLLQSNGPEGLLSIDAADFDLITAHNLHTWAPVDLPGFTGAGALEASPDINWGSDKDFVNNSPRVDYQVEFRHAGTHYVWVRGLGPSGKDDSLHVGLDGAEVSTASRIDGFGPSFGWSQQTRNGAVATITVPSPGVHTLNIWAREDGFVADKVVLTTNASYQPSGNGPAFSKRDGMAADPIQQSDQGVVSIDAADFDQTLEYNVHQWLPAYPSGFTGTSALEASPNVNWGIDSGFVGNSPRVDYQVDFQFAGTHYVWVRGFGPTGADDSLHVGLNGAAVDTSDRIEGFGPSFGWSQDTRDGAVATITIPSPGVHTVNVWAREDGFVLDRLLLVTDATFQPSAEGPAFSTRTTSSTDSTSSTTAGSSPTAIADAVTTTEGTPVTINVLANDIGVDDTPPTVAVIGSPTYGETQVNGDNSVNYTPQAGYSGEDGFIYRITDADGDQSAANVSIQVECVTCATDTDVKVSWTAIEGTVDGYRVFIGATAETATSQVSDLPLNSGLVDLNSPSIIYNGWGDLGLRNGDTACFRIKAYNAIGTSPASEAACQAL